MERNFGPKEELPASAANSGILAPPMSVEDAYINGFIPELSFQSVLQPLSLTLVNYSPFDGGVSFHSQSQMPAVPHSALVRHRLVSEEFLKSETWRHGEVLDQKLKMPKQEHLNMKDFAFELLKLNNGVPDEAAFTEPLINFFDSSPPTNPCLGIIDRTEFTGHFSHPQPLRQPQVGFESEQFYHFNPTDSSSFPKYQINSTSMTVKRSTPTRQRAEGVAKKRRPRISDKIRSLEKLLPWNRRMDIATTLEEVYKYVKFLQAQIHVLQAMPLCSTGSCSLITVANEDPDLDEFGGGVLATLTRQQLLEVVMNSPGAQTVLYSRGSCVYSTEQLLLLKKMAEKAAEEKMFFPTSQY